MTRLQELQQRYAIIQKKLTLLQEEYTEKRKGTRYQNRYSLLVGQMEDLKKKVLSYGTSGNVILVTGKRSRVNKRNPKLRVLEKVEIYLVNINPSDVPELLKLKYKNLVEYSMEVKTPGEIIKK